MDRGLTQSSDGRAPDSVPWGVGQALAVLIGLQLLVMLGGLLLGVLDGGLATQMIYTAVADAAVLGLLLLFAFMRCGEWNGVLRKLGLVRPARGVAAEVGKVTIAGLVAYGALVMGKARMLDALGRDEFPLQRISRAILESDSSFGVLCAVTVAVIVAPVVEELLFRGLLYLPLRSRTGILPAAVLVAGIFALFHSYPWGLPDLVLLSLIFTGLFEASGSLLVPMAAHGLFNGLSILLLRIGSGGV